MTLFALYVEPNMLFGESSGGGVLWAPNDVFPQVMGPERHGWVHGCGHKGGVAM